MKFVRCGDRVCIARSPRFRRNPAYRAELEIGTRFALVLSAGGQINDALAAAMARLGERGWEPVGLTQPSPENQPSVLMKRIRVSE
jgi:hypothetical protein